MHVSGPPGTFASPMNGGASGSGGAGGGAGSGGGAAGGGVSWIDPPAVEADGAAGGGVSLCGEGGGGRRRGLAAATRAATDHDLALSEKFGETRHSSPSSGSASMAAVSTEASSAISPGPIDEPKRCGRRI